MTREQDLKLLGVRVLASVALLLVWACRAAEPQAATAARSIPNDLNPPTLDLREPMALAAGAIPPRLDPKMDFRPWFMLRGHGGIPTTPEHASWDLADMTGRYLESLILSRRMGICSPELSQAEDRLQTFLFKIIGPDGLVHDPQSGAIDHSFSQGSALYGLLALFEDSSDPAVRRALEKLITAQLKRAERHGDLLVDPTVKLEQSSGSHLAGYQIYPIIRFYELTGYPDALTLAEGLTRWAISDPVLGPKGDITKALSWEGHIHSWLDTLAGCARTTRNSSSLDRAAIIARCRAVYDWVQRSNATSFGWIATYPTGGSSETCAISSAIRLALELAAAGDPEYLEDVERFVRNQVPAAQFRDLRAYDDGTNHPTPLLVGCFDSQSMPNGHLGTRGGEDVGTVEGCCLNGGMRALALAWDASQTADENGVTLNLALTRSGPGCDVIGYQPLAGRVDVIPRFPGSLRIRIPSWAQREQVSVLLLDPNGPATPITWRFEKPFVVLSSVQPGSRVSVRYPLREKEEDVVAGGQKFHIRWKGDVVVDVSPPGQREPAYGRSGVWSSQRPESVAVPSLAPTHSQRPMLSPLPPGEGKGEGNSLPVPPFSNSLPDTFYLQDAARLASMSMLARMDLQRSGQPFFRIYPFASPPRAEHEKWDDGDMSGRYVEALILARHLTGLSMDPRETLLRQYLASLFDPTDGVCYTRGTAWTPRRACLFSQSSAMLGLLAWYRETGSATARNLLDRHADGVMHIAVDKGNHAYFPKYEWEGQKYVDDPQGKDAPIWYGGRLILPLVEYWQISQRADLKTFLDKLVRHCTEVSHFIGPNGEVEKGEGWWGHLHSTMDMVTGIAEYGRLTNRPELVAWAKRVYEWIGRTQTTGYGFVADVSGGHICEACAIGSRIRLSLALYRAGALNPFGDIDRYLRNQLLEDQFVDLSFLAPLKPETPRTDRAVYAGVDHMLRGTFQCWGTANDLIGNDDIEGCGAGGGVQGIALASNAQYEWRDTGQGSELRVHLLFNRKLRARAKAQFTTAAPVAAELWSYLPYEGRVVVPALEPIDRLALRIPDGAELSAVRVRRHSDSTAASNLRGVSFAEPDRSAQFDNRYALIEKVLPGETIELRFPIKEYETVEHAAGLEYRVQWKGPTVVRLSPLGIRVPLYAHRDALKQPTAPTCADRYPK